MDFDDNNSKTPEKKADRSIRDSKPNSKRRLIISSAPLLVAVANRPAWANMCSVSGAMSGPHSGQTEPEACLGCTPGFWKNNWQAWPLADPGLEIPGFEDVLTGECLDKKATAEYTPKTCKTWDFSSGTQFDDPLLFPKAAAALGLTNLSLMGVLWFATKKGGNVPFSHAFGGHIVAGLFNSATFSNEYGYTAQAFVQMIEAAFDVPSTFPTGTSDFETLKNLLDTNNNRGCPIDAHGNSNI